MNWLVVGTGDVARKRVFPALEREPHSTLYGVVTRDPARGRRLAPRAWDDLEVALTDPAVDAVYIATPVFLHAPQAVQALRAGKHVLCEKPVAMSYEEALDMVRAAEASERLLGVAYFRRLYPKLRRAKELLEQNVIGRPLMALAACGEWLPPGSDSRRWFFEPGCGGSGPFYDIGSHRVDALNFLLGQPVRVTAQFSNVIHQAAVEDSATALIEYETGARAVVDARWNTHVHLDEFRIIGVDGEMDLTPLNGPSLRYPGGAEELPSDENRHFPCVENFVRALRGEADLACSAAASLPAAWVLSEALKAAGRT